MSVTPRDQRVLAVLTVLATIKRRSIDGRRDPEGRQRRRMAVAAVIGIGRTLGSIEVRKIADLVVYHADPTADIRALRNPVRVFRAGRLVGTPK